MTDWFQPFGTKIWHTPVQSLTGFHPAGACPEAISGMTSQNIVASANAIVARDIRFSFSASLWANHLLLSETDDRLRRQSRLEAVISNGMRVRVLAIFAGTPENRHDRCT